MLKCVENCGPRHPPKRVINFFFLNQTKKIYNKAEELYCDATIFFLKFFIAYLPKKMETEKWPKAADSPLYSCFLLELKYRRLTKELNPVTQSLHSNLTQSILEKRKNFKGGPQISIF